MIKLRTFMNYLSLLLGIRIVLSVAYYFHVREEFYPQNVMGSCVFCVFSLFFQLFGKTTMKLVLLGIKILFCLDLIHITFRLWLVFPLREHGLTWSDYLKWNFFSEVSLIILFWLLMPICIKAYRVKIEGEGVSKSVGRDSL